MGKDVAVRFWAKVNKDGPLHPRLGTRCWLWTACRSGKYGTFYTGGRHIGAHRFSYGLHNARSIEGLDVDHKCHNELCVNPEHLRAVTRKQNVENLRGAHCDSTTGIRGVWKQGDRWRARVMHNGKRVSAGMFATSAEAEAAIVTLRNELFSCNDIDREILV